MYCPLALSRSELRLENVCNIIKMTLCWRSNHNKNLNLIAINYESCSKILLITKNITLYVNNIKEVNNLIGKRKYHGRLKVNKSSSVS